MMKELASIEQRIYNDGERLIPGVTHDIREHIRHRSSYEFFKRVILEDRRSGAIGNRVSILDLGFGAGWGCQLLATIPGSTVVGVDISLDCQQYAQEHYPAENVELVVADVSDFLKESKAEFDYVVSRGVLEHVECGLDAMRVARWTKRMIIDVPYDEDADVNHHHVLTNIVESDFDEFPDAELFYEDLDGVIFDSPDRPPRPNLIMCILSDVQLKRVSVMTQFPVPAWHPPGYTPLGHISCQSPGLWSRIKRELRRLAG